MTPLLQVQDISKSFSRQGNQKKVLSHISFEVFPGQVLGIVGPSGSGKSTLLRTINALETIQEGRMFLRGESYETFEKNVYRLRQQIGMIFQRFELFPHKTALENVVLPLQVVKKMKRHLALKRAKENLERVALAEYAHQYPAQLSGGQQQRVAIARALAMEPVLLLCDEPTSALDPELVEEVASILRQVAKEGVTMMVVTHELKFCRTVATDMLFLDKGEVLEKAATTEFFGSPKSPRLKSFLDKVS